MAKQEYTNLSERILGYLFNQLDPSSTAILKILIQLTLKWFIYSVISATDQWCSRNKGFKTFRSTVAICRVLTAPVTITILSSHCLACFSSSVHPVGINTQSPHLRLFKKITIRIGHTDTSRYESQDTIRSIILHLTPFPPLLLIK